MNVEDKEKVKSILEEKLDLAAVKTKKELVSLGIFRNLTLLKLGLMGWL